MKWALNPREHSGRLSVVGKSEITHPSLRSEQDQAGREDHSRGQSSILGGLRPRSLRKPTRSGVGGEQKVVQNTAAELGNVQPRLVLRGHVLTSY